MMPRLDWSIKLSDILVALSMALAGVGLYTGLDHRVSSLEQLVIFQKQVDMQQDKHADELKADLLAALKEMRGSVERLGDRIDGQRAKGIR